MRSSNTYHRHGEHDCWVDVREEMTKQHIIDEIKRTAKANGGIPLGVDRFLKETGIKESDWRGRFWVRWNDAVREAGFKPNQKQTAIDDDVLLDKLAVLVRELGHFPVIAELRMKDAQDPSFPNFKVFSRFGRKHEWVARVCTYCETRPGYEDVLAICATATPNKADEAIRDTESVLASSIF